MSSEPAHDQVANDDVANDHEDGRLDPSEAVRLLRASDTERDALIERYGLVGHVEREMAAELAMTGPLAHPERFGTAYRRAMYAVEVLDRNGARNVSIPRLGPLVPVASAVVGLITRWIVRGHQARLISDMRRIFSRREAISDPSSVEYHLLRRARFHAVMLEPGYRGTQLGVPAFLVGGAALTGLTSGVEAVVLSAFGSKHVGIIVSLTAGLVLFAMSWCALRAAGVARRRIRISTDAAMVDLWAVIGGCGRPPKDQSFLFALIAIVLAALSSLAVPFLLYLVVGG